jgi:hypothetical protein
MSKTDYCVESVSSASDRASDGGSSSSISFETPERNVSGESESVPESFASILELSTWGVFFSLVVGLVLFY